MRHLLFPLLSALFFSLVISSCKTSRDVATGNLLQKRKYTKGYHLNIGSKKKQNLHAKNISRPATVVQEKPAPEKEQERLLAALEGAVVPAQQAHKQITSTAPFSGPPVTKKEPAPYKSRYHKPDTDLYADSPPDPMFAILAFVFTLSVIFIPIGFVFSIVALALIHKDPEQYGGKVFAMIAFFIGLALMVFIVGALLFVLFSTI